MFYEISEKPLEKNSGLSGREETLVTVPLHDIISFYIYLDQWDQICSPFIHRMFKK